MILIIDNYDSFTYNLVALVRTITGTEPVVKRNDRFLLQEVAQYDKIMLSPGPGIPSEAGQLMALLEQYAAQKSILGICLGHQAIGSHYGAKLSNMPQVVHGHKTAINQIADDPLFLDIPAQFYAGRYHSWVVDATGLPGCLEVLAEDEEGLIMALRHKVHDVKGLQFHPESIMTEAGERIIANWLKNEQ